ncbi:MAG: HesA/MoeB/ThiF family protein [Bacteroidales bacterium]
MKKPNDMPQLSENELKRYHRQIIIPSIGEEGQKKLRHARAVVIGAGGLGSPVLMYLAAAGVGTIGIIDSDEVSTSNLQRQVLYLTGDIGRLKAETAAERISLLNPLITVRSNAVRFTEDNASELLESYDIAVDCSDNYATRYLISDAALKAGIPMVYGAVYQFMGQASVFNYKGGPSYRDLFPEEMHRSGDNKPDPPGVIGALPGIIGSVQACEVIKIITGAGDILSGKLLQIDALNLRAEIISI